MIIIDNNIHYNNYNCLFMNVYVYSYYSNGCFDDNVLLHWKFVLLLERVCFSVSLLLESAAASCFLLSSGLPVTSYMLHTT